MAVLSSWIKSNRFDGCQSHYLTTMSSSNHTDTQGVHFAFINCFCLASKVHVRHPMPATFSLCLLNAAKFNDWFFYSRRSICPAKSNMNFISCIGLMGFFFLMCSTMIIAENQDPYLDAFYSTTNYFFINSTNIW